MTEEEIAKNKLFTIRPGCDDDLKFIYSTWLPSLYTNNDWFHRIPIRLYEENYGPIIERTLSRPEAQVKVCCLKETPDVIIAYSVIEGSTLHFVYCKHSWRGMKILRSLLPDPFKQVSQLTYQMDTILERKFPTVIFNPFLI